MFNILKTENVFELKVTDMCFQICNYDRDITFKDI